MTGRASHTASIIVGRKFTGKSTKLAAIAAKYPKTAKVLIIDVNESPAYNQYKEISIDRLKNLKSGVVRLKGTPTKDTLLIIAKYFRDGLVIFEDCTKYISGYVSPEIKAFLTDHRMWRCDLIFTFHSLKMVPPFFWGMVSHVMILKTQENFLSKENERRVPNYQVIADAYTKVKKHPDNYYCLTVETLI